MVAGQSRTDFDHLYILVLWNEMLETKQEHWRSKIFYDLSTQMPFLSNISVILTGSPRRVTMCASGYQSVFHFHKMNVESATNRRTDNTPFLVVQRSA